MNKRWICSDVLMDILPSFNRPQLGLKLALLSDRFDILVDAHFNAKSELTLWRPITIYKEKNMGLKARLGVCIDGKFLDFPLPDRPLPNNIRFSRVHIEYTDHSVITFLHANKHIWERSGTLFEMYVSGTKIVDDEQPIWDVLAREIWPIFAPSIRSLSLTDAEHFDPLCRRILPTILADLDQLIAVDFEYMFLHGIADDGPNATSSTSQVLFKWLHTPRKDGQLKNLLWSETELYLEGSLDWINSFKETFIRATASSVSYKIMFGIGTSPSPTPIEPFELVNERTKEKMTLTKGGYIYWLLKRCPIVGETADPWEDDENWDSKLNIVKFSFYDHGTGNCIGPLSPPAEKDKEKEEADESNEN